MGLLAVRETVVDERTWGRFAPTQFVSEGHEVAAREYSACKTGG